MAIIPMTDLEVLDSLLYEYNVLPVTLVTQNMISDWPTLLPFHSGIQYHATILKQHCFVFKSFQESIEYIAILYL